MSEVIHKLTLDVFSDNIFEIPIGAKILYVKEQHNQACMWYICDPKSITEKRQFFIVGTGCEPPNNSKYIGSAHLTKNPLHSVLVWHIFEIYN